MMQSEKTGYTRRSFAFRMMTAGFLGLLLDRRQALSATVKRPLPDVDLSFVEEHVPVLRRNEWAQEAPRTWLLREGGVYDRITVHHQGGRQSVTRNKSAVAAEIDAIYGGHRRHRYGDIAYHFIVDYAGRVWEGRSLAYQGAHVSRQNVRNLGILVLGNFEEQSPSAASLETLETLVGALRSGFGVKKHRVYGHCDIGSSVCPGKNLYPYVENMRKGNEADRSNTKSTVKGERDDTRSEDS